MSQLYQDFGDLDAYLSGAMSISVDTATEPAIEIVEQPKARGYRFRYASEGGSHGPLLGENTSKKQKKFPSVQILNYKGPAKIVVSLVTEDDPPQIHAHNLVGPMVQNGYALYEVEDKQNMVVSLTKLSIEHVTGAKTMITLIDKLHQEEHIERLRSSSSMQTSNVDEVIRSLPGESEVDDAHLSMANLGIDKEKYREQAKQLKEKMNLGVVRLRIDAFLPSLNSSAYTRALPSVYSQPIFDQKTLGELRIVKMSKTSGSVSGNDEVILLCEKVSKDNIEIRFYTDEGQVPWEDFGRFTPADVHKQYAISFITPPYKDKGISKPVEVMVELRRKTGESYCSQPVKFTYQPLPFDSYKIGEKRRKMVPEGLDQYLGRETSFAQAAAPTLPFNDVGQSSFALEEIEQFLQGAGFM